MAFIMGTKRKTDLTAAISGICVQPLWETWSNVAELLQLHPSKANRSVLKMPFQEKQCARNGGDKQITDKQSNFFWLV